MKIRQMREKLLPLALAGSAFAQNYANASISSVASSTTVNGTAVVNPSAFVTNMQLSVEGEFVGFTLPVQFHFCYDHPIS